MLDRYFWNVNFPPLRLRWVSGKRFKALLLKIMILWLNKEQPLPVWLARQDTAVTLITEFKNSLTTYVRSAPCTQFHPPQGEIKQHNEDELKFCSQTHVCQIQALRGTCVQPGIWAETLYFYRVIWEPLYPTMRAEHKVVNVLAKQLLVGRMLFAVSFLSDRHCLLDDREGAAGSTSPAPVTQIQSRAQDPLEVGKGCGKMDNDH